MHNPFIQHTFMECLAPSWVLGTWRWLTGLNRPVGKASEDILEVQHPGWQVMQRDAGAICPTPGQGGLKPQERLSQVSYIKSALAWLRGAASTHALIPHTSVEPYYVTSTCLHGLYILV